MADDIILGIDPGSLVTGYGLVKKSGGRLYFVTAGAIRLTVDSGLAKRLELIYAGLSAVIKQFVPTTSAVEGIFHGHNQRSALLLGHARGAAVLAAAHGGLSVSEYSPTEIKQAVVGYGMAEKSQIQHMVKVILNLNQRLSKDASDALAVAICHANNLNYNTIANFSAYRRV